MRNGARGGKGGSPSAIGPFPIGIRRRQIPGRTARELSKPSCAIAPQPSDGKEPDETPYPGRSGMALGKLSVSGQVAAGEGCEIHRGMTSLRSPCRPRYNRLCAKRIEKRGGNLLFRAQSII